MAMDLDKGKGKSPRIPNLFMFKFPSCLSGSCTFGSSLLFTSFQLFMIELSLNFDEKYFNVVTALIVLVRKRGLPCCRGRGRMSGTLNTLRN